MADGGARTAVVIEDDADIRELLVAVLTQAGFVTHEAATGLDGVEAVRRLEPLLTTLDVSLPDIDGLEVARRVRQFSQTYIVMLTARAEEIDTLLGLDAGADDYQTKPFRPRELRARIEAMLRRPRTLGSSAPAAAPSAPPGQEDRRDDEVLVRAGLVVDVAGRTVRVDGVDTALTRTEFDLLAALAARPGRVVAKDDLVRVVWAGEYDTGLAVTESDRRSVEVHLANLRRKIGDDAARPRWIATVRGVGYRFAAPGADARW